MTIPVHATGGAAPTAPAAASKADAKANERGEGFERMLLGQLTRTLIDSALPTDGAASASTSAYKDLLPDALTEALMSGGGIGLAETLKGLEK
jgi:Rod binding domain-containing protein